VVAVNIGWPRTDVYNAIPPHHWYLQWGAVLFIGLVAIVGAIYYFAVYRRKPMEVLAEHRAAVPAGPAAPLGEVAP
jgi:hypothetical protein